MRERLLGEVGRWSETTVMLVRAPVRVGRDPATGEFRAECTLLGVEGRGKTRLIALEAMRGAARAKVRAHTR